MKGRLAAERHRLFVGRAAELNLFLDALEKARCCLLYVTGPAGIGKTALLQEMAWLCDDRGVPYSWSEGQPPTLSRVVFLDPYDTALDTWMLRTFLPSLPDDVLVVLATREKPSLNWRSDAGWGSLLLPVALDPLSPAESQALLERRGIPSSPPLIAEAGGNPLVLTLLKELPPHEAWRTVEAQGGVRPPEPTPQAQRLDREAFEEALREALKQLLRPDELTQSPLLNTRMVIHRAAGNRDRVPALVQLLHEGAALMQAAPKDEKLFKALDSAYFHPAPTQEVAAQWLDVPLSSYKRHLRNGIERLADVLWHWDHEGPPTIKIKTASILGSEQMESTLVTGGSRGYLTVVAGPEKGRTLPITRQDGYVVRITAPGFKESDVQIEDISVGRGLRLEYRDGRFQLSGGGVILNDHSIEGSVPLEEGDIIQVGDTKIQYATGGHEVWAPGRYYLEVRNGLPQDAGKKHLMRPPTIRVGRARDCSVQLHDPGVSRHHLTIVGLEKSFYLIHEGANPTYVNGTPVTKERGLAHGDEILICSTVLRFVDRDQEAY